MSTTKAVRQALHQRILTWFAAPDPEFTVPIAPDNIKRFSTAPDDESESPNWIIISTVSDRLEKTTTGDSTINPRLAVWLLSRLGTDEASKEASLDWIDDAEEWMLQKLDDEVNQLHWINIKIIGNPRRDSDPAYHGRYRTSLIAVEIEKR
jgi:hypothetical protein